MRNLPGVVWGEGGGRRGLSKRLREEGGKGLLFPSLLSDRPHTFLHNFHVPRPGPPSAVYTDTSLARPCLQETWVSSQELHRDQASTQPSCVVRTEPGSTGFGDRGQRELTTWKRREALPSRAGAARLPTLWPVWGLLMLPRGAFSRRMQKQGQSPGLRTMQGIS